MRILAERCPPVRRREQIGCAAFVGLPDVFFTQGGQENVGRLCFLFFNLLEINWL